MRRLLTTIFFLVLGITCIQAQKKIVWFDAGLKVQSGFNGIYNQAIVDHPDVDYAIGSALGFGGKFGINWSYTGITIDAMYSTADSEFKRGNVNDLLLKTKNIDLYVLLRNERNLSYFEIGPRFSFLRDATWRERGEQNIDVTDHYKNGIGAVIGFGANFFGTEGRFSGKLGLRFEYGITDIVTESGQEAFAPVNTVDIYAEGYKGSHPLTASLVFEMNWGLGFYGKTQCGGKKKFFSL